MGSFKKSAAPWYKYFPDDFEKAFRGMTLTEVGLLQLILNAMWSSPEKCRLKWDSGMPVLKRELAVYLRIDRRQVEIAIDKILRKTSLISINDKNEFYSEYLETQADSWNKNNRGDR